MNGDRLIRKNTLSCQQNGMTLIEIMIALLLGVFLLAGVIQIFISSRETNRVQEALSRLQENGRFAMDFIGRDIRMADYRACDNKGFLENAGFRTGVTGTDGGVNAADRALDPPDSITVRWSEVPPCIAVVAHAYTIAVPASGSELRRDGNSLIEGVENMQITYGVDTDAIADGVPNYYGQAGAVAGTVTPAEMAKVVSVRVSLLLYTIDNNVTAAPLAYTYNGATTTPVLPDRRIRRVFNSTFTLRNRVQ
jgi:type IV pilus assembly protein PilW